MDSLTEHRSSVAKLRLIELVSSFVVLWRSCRNTRAKLSGNVLDDVQDCGNCTETEVQLQIHVSVLRTERYIYF